MRRSTHQTSITNTTRTTIMLPMTTDAQLDIYCVIVRQSKSEVINKALARFLKEEGGLDANKMPHLPKDNSHKSVA